VCKQCYFLFARSSSQGEGEGCRHLGEMLRLRSTTFATLIWGIFSVLCLGEFGWTLLRRRLIGSHWALILAGGLDLNAAGAVVGHIARTGDEIFDSRAAVQSADGNRWRPVLSQLPEIQQPERARFWAGVASCPSPARTPAERQTQVTVGPARA
jgi:hypothetical protein